MSTRLATCSYAEYRPDMGVPVRISLGRPKFMSIPSNAVCPELQPRGWYFHASDDDFLAAYDAQLSRYGTERLQDRFDAIAAEFGQPLVLLCFESLASGEWCHRTHFRQFWLRQTGQDIPELGASTRRPHA